MHGKKQRINARLTDEQLDKASRLLASKKIYGVHSYSDLVIKGLMNLYDTVFRTPIEEAAANPGPHENSKRSRDRKARPTPTLSPMAKLAAARAGKGKRPAARPDKHNTAKKSKVKGGAA